MGNRKKILISAHEVSPEQGSACSTGWEITRRLGRYHDITVLCASGPTYASATYKNAIDRYIEKNGDIEGVKYIFVDQTRFAKLKPKKGLGFRPTFYLAYKAWQHRAYKVALELNKNSQIDVMHHLNAMGFREPGFLFKLNAPFVWGPIGGYDYIPYDFVKDFSNSEIILKIVRDIANKFQIAFSLRVRKAIKMSSRIFCATKEINGVISRISDKTELMIESGVDICSDAYIHIYDGVRPLRIAWSGTHRSIKALPVLLEALAKLQCSQNYSLHVLGDGPETSRWKKMADTLNISNINWYGWCSREKALEVVRDSDVFVLTSLQEGTSHVLTEAMGFGVPVICHDICGMGIAIDSKSGMKIPLISKNDSVAGFMQKIELIMQNPEMVESMSKGALIRAEELSWDNKVYDLACYYDQLCSSE